MENLLALCESFGASDIHLSVGFPPRFRIGGELIERGRLAPFDLKAVDAIAMELALETLPVGCPDGTERVRVELVRTGALDGAFTSSSGERYRFNVYRAFDRTAVAMRRIDAKLRTFGELGLPGRLEGFCSEREGLFVVTGPTGSGKSTTLATMIDVINRTRSAHIVTIEDPIEHIHPSSRSFVHQRQVGRDTRSFNDALVESLRQDPDVILVGEMRDLATVRTALRAAETGHLVFTTLHAGDCAGAVERLVSVFPAEEQSSARRQLSLVLRGIFAQHLMAASGGSGRALACELLVNTKACANLIASGRTAQLYSLVETGAASGMRTLDQSLAELVRAGRVSADAALALSKNPDLLASRLQQPRAAII